VPAVVARPRIGEPIGSCPRKAESIVKLAIGEQSSIGGDDRIAKLESQPAVEIEPQRFTVGFTAGFVMTSASKSA
jgi:hypothetical protein